MNRLRIRLQSLDALRLSFGWSSVFPPIDKAIDGLTQEFYQQRLETVESIDPGLSARIDVP